MRRKTVFMFSGQGSHYYQMGRELFDIEATFRSTISALDDIAYGMLGFSVLERLYHPACLKSAVLDELLVTHPAIFMVEYALARSLMNAGIKPDYLLGASLGTFVAYAVAGSIPVERALSTIIAQAKLFHSIGRRGGMVAVLATPDIWHRDSVLHRGSEIAGINFDGHFVLSAPNHSLMEVEATLRRQNLSFQRLAVSQPFHSRWIDDARPHLQDALVDVKASPGAVPVICCAAAEERKAISAQEWWDIVREPIRFKDTIQSMMSWGEFDYVDVGPGGTLATFVKYNLPTGSGSTTHAAMTPFGSDAKSFAAIVSKLSSR